MICPKRCWKSEAVAQLSSVKLKFYKTSQISQKKSNMESLIRKTVSPEACNFTKKDTISGVFLLMYLCECIFSLLLFFRKDKSNHRRCFVKKDVRKNFENLQESTCAGLFF